jgi:hypothetical protein
MMDPMPEYSFAARDGQVEVHQGDQPIWVGRIHDVSVLDAFALPGTPDGIVVLDWMDEPEGVEAWQPYRLVPMEPWSGGRNCPRTRSPLRKLDGKRAV